MSRHGTRRTDDPGALDLGDESADPDGNSLELPEDDEDKDDVMTPDTRKAVMRDWLRTFQPQPVPGSPDSPGNDPGARIRSRLAAGHPVTSTPPGGDPHDPGRVDRHDWNQALRPAPLATIQSVYGGNECRPLASSIEQHQGRVMLGLLDQSAAANPTLTTQLGRNAPTHNPERAAGPDSPAPSGQGEASGRTPQRNPGPAYRPSAMGGMRPAGWTPAPSLPVRRAPGE